MLRMPFCRRVSLLALFCLAATTASAEMPHNVILLIGDGMGSEHVRAASFYLYGEDGKLVMQSLPYHGEAITDSLNSPARPTDSAAAATALATGCKVANGVLSLRITTQPAATSAQSQATTAATTQPVGVPIKTVLEVAKELGKATAVLTTTDITDATPAGFTVHVSARGLAPDIAKQQIQQRADVMMGGIGGGLTSEMVTQAGYLPITTREELLAISGTVTRVWGLFGKSHMPSEYADAQRKTATQPATQDGRDYDTLPHLSEMVPVALSIVEKDPDGFFMMLEGGCIDKAAHKNLLPNEVCETVEFDKAVAAVMQWAKGRGDTLVIITADHETGGLTIDSPNDKGQFPTVNYTTKGHTRANVPVWAWGVGGGVIDGAVIDNTDIHALMLGQYAPAPAMAKKAPASRPAKAPALEPAMAN